jgi:hypothetical protein
VKIATFFTIIALGCALSLGERAEAQQVVTTCFQIEKRLSFPGNYNIVFSTAMSDGKILAGSTPFAADHVGFWNYHTTSGPIAALNGLAYVCVVDSFGDYACLEGNQEEERFGFSNETYCYFADGTQVTKEALQRKFP